MLSCGSLNSLTSGSLRRCLAWANRSRVSPHENTISPTSPRRFETSCRDRCYEFAAFRDSCRDHLRVLLTIRWGPIHLRTGFRRCQRRSERPRYSSGKCRAENTSHNIRTWHNRTIHRPGSLSSREHIANSNARRDGPEAHSSIHTDFHFGVTCARVLRARCFPL